MTEYRVTRIADGTEVKPGDTVTDFRGRTGVFDHVSRGVEYNGTAKTIVDGFEFYGRVWGLKVETLVTVAEALAELPTESGNAVAEFFREKGITGYRYSEGGDCPLQAWIRLRTGIAVATVATRTWLDGNEDAYFVHTDAIRGFVSGFDGEAYPHLIA